MATNATMKSFYRQRKKSETTCGGGLPKPKARPSNKSPATTLAFATVGSDVPHSPALLSHSSPYPQDEYDDKEEVLRQFDMNMAYGPCLGMTRLARWERASRLGLKPPKEIGVLLETDKVLSECLWDGRI